MGIKIIQKCDGCGISRELSEVRYGVHGGWLQSDDAWLCAGCIKIALRRNKGGES